MSVLSDAELMILVEREGIIKPFVANLISKVLHSQSEDWRNDDGGERIISYGLSSYGYDCRAKDSYLVYHNLHCAYVDPKDFDHNNFVTVEGKGYVLIPPNSFALTETVEYIKVPRNCIVLVAAKSTYARCFNSNTKIALVDGTFTTFANMISKPGNYWGYGLDEKGYVVISELTDPRFVGMDNLLEITLDDGSVIECTPDHEFVVNTSWVEPVYKSAGDLVPGESLRPLYRSVTRGYEYVYGLTSRRWIPTHTLANEWNITHGAYDRITDYDKHHIDRNTRNNNPWNIKLMPEFEHIRMHNAEYYGELFDSEMHGDFIRRAFRGLYEDPEWYDKFCESQHLKAVNFWNQPQYTSSRERLLSKLRFRNQSAERRAYISTKLRQYYLDFNNRTAVAERSKDWWANHASEERRNKQREIARQLNRRDDVTPDKLYEALHKAGSVRGAGKLLNADPTTFNRPDLKPIVTAFKQSDAYQPHTRQKLNHKIASIKELKGTHEVYCLQSETGNFALEAGVFVHNCGLVVNATLLEPEWEGTVTLELSNTTTLPVKVYSNEGIVQLIFFKADSPCDISYADRRGKYQNQRGITLPKV